MGPNHQDVVREILALVACMAAGAAVALANASSWSVGGQLQEVPMGSAGTAVAIGCLLYLGRAAVRMIRKPARH